MARVIAFRLFFTNLTTSAFYFGVTRQQITDSLLNRGTFNCSISSKFDYITNKHSPSIITHFFLFSFIHRLKVSNRSLIFTTNISFFNSYNLITVISPYTNPQLLPIFSAVSNLSPVNIHTFI